jgi:chlorite dismutase
MAEELVFASYQAYRAVPEKVASLDRDVAAKEIRQVLDDNDEVETRGIYSTAGFRADTDLLFWFVGSSIDRIQDLVVALGHTQLGRALERTHSFVGLVRPAEFAPDHRPAFVQGKPPRRYACVYPFVRTPEWYLLDSQERGKHLSSHGALGREYPDVDPNTTSAFGMNDYEWILAFEADSLDRLVDLIRHLRANESRLYVKEEIPFITGIRKELDDILQDLPF